jgi:hypothetical protein
VEERPKGAKLVNPRKQEAQSKRKKGQDAEEKKRGGLK